MESINPIQSLINHIARCSHVPVQAVNSERMRSNVILVSIQKSSVTIMNESRVCFRCRCEAYVRGRVEHNVVGLLSEVLKKVEDADSGNENEIEAVEQTDKTESVSMFGDGQVETSIAFTYYLETSYNETVVPLTGIEWESVE